MHTSIDFPNLGIHLSSVRDHITIGGFDIAFYGLLIALAIMVGVFITVREAEPALPGGESPGKDME